MVFAPHDLIFDPPFAGLDLVTCRNLLIYLEPETTEHVLFLLHSSLKPGGKASMSVRLTPLQTGRDEAWDRMLVSFIDESDGPNECHADSGGIDVDAAADWQGTDLVAHQELEASREELQALNEELNASNALLNTSNDDLNEANLQLQQKIAQLEMQSRVLSSGEVMTLFLDADLRLRWFTPGMREVLPLSADDSGRRIGDLVSKFRDSDFFKDIEDVLHATAPREAVVRNDSGTWLMRRTFPYLSDSGEIVGVAITYTDVSDRTRADAALRSSEAMLRRSQSWLSAQNEAFRAAMGGAPLEASLGILVRALTGQAEDDRRCAFYLAEGGRLRHVTGMPDAYARCVDGFLVSPESLACGLAVAAGAPVITRDVLDEPRWQPWTWLAHEFGYRGCWSFPVRTPEREVVGSLAMYFPEPREPSLIDLELAAAFTRTAGVIISRALETR